jgi:PAS domain S-box-containing protein
MNNERKFLDKDLKILLVDDSDTDCADFENILEKIICDKGKFRREHNYKDALTLITEERFDIYFIDYTLGSKSGLDLIREANNLGCTGPYIILTRTDRPDLYQHSSEMNVYGFLLKDEINESQLLRHIIYMLERRKIEQELIDAHRFSNNIIEYSPDIIVTLDESHKIINANEAAINTIWHDRDTIIGRDIYEFAYFDMSDEKRFVASKNFYRTKMEMADGSFKTIEWKAFDPQGDDSTLVLLGRDVTQQIEDEKIKIQNEKMLALGHLSGGVAHEINNLLQPIMLNVEVLKDEIKSQEGKVLLHDIHHNTKMATSIVDDILVFSKGNITVSNAQPFPEVFEETLELIKTIIPKTVTLDVDNQIKNEHWHTYADVKNLHRVLSNLVLNAADALDDKGTIKISIVKMNKEKKDFIRIGVKDTGKGMTDEELKLIFNPFYSTKSIGKGTGLGLSIVHNLVKEWGGYIVGDSKRGAGTQMNVYIPVCKDY